MPKSVLVTGASGFIAQQLVLDLLAAGHKVRGTVRDPARADELRQALARHDGKAVDIELVQADLESDAGWAEAVAGMDAVHHLASPFPMAAPKNPDDLIRPARDGALRVLRAAHKAGVQRVILTSSCAAIAYGWGDKLPAECTEADWTDPDNLSDTTAYTRSKTIAERAAWDFVAGEGKGLELTTINPVAVLGPIRSKSVRTSVDIIARVLDGRLPAMPNVGIQVVDVRDVSAAHIAAMDNPESIGERYILAGDYYTIEDMVRVLRAAYPDRSKLPSRKLPDFIVRFGGLFSGDMKTIAMELGKRRFCSSAKVRKFLDRDLIPGEEAIRASARTLIEFGAV
jgi:nucleoside-diphosphate-sugar epimerase